jgi:hypothetical protein|tara:strand:+ start:108 stop:533 length:426 start_codon:yes stop_codon:yes gene_type:complete
MPDGELHKVFQRAASIALPTTTGLANTNDPWLGAVSAAKTVRVEDTRRAALVEDAPDDKWQPGDGYRPRTENLQAVMDAALANEPEAGEVGAQRDHKMVSPASCGYRYGKAKSRGSVIAANAPAIANYTPPALRSSLHESS